MILENTLKPYPRDIVSHPAIDAGVEAHGYFSNNTEIAVLGRLPQEALNVFSFIEARVTPLTIRLCGVQHPERNADDLQYTSRRYHWTDIWQSRDPRWTW